jgi:hypothetical protein
VILLDTNVVSEVMRPEPNTTVADWFADQEIDRVFLSTITIAELLFGVQSLPDGRRKQALSGRIERLIEDFADRIVAFDAPAARVFADLAVRARQKGKAFPIPDGYIAAIAAARQFAVATRDSAPFEAAGLSVIDPWRPRAQTRSHLVFADTPPNPNEERSDGLAG